MPEKKKVSDHPEKKESVPKVRHHLKKEESVPKFSSDFLILGMDLSLSSPGFCVLEYSSGKISVIELTRVNNKTEHSTLKRLDKIAEEIERIFKTTLRYKSESLWQLPYVAIRESSFSRFAAETQAISKVNGVAELTAYRCGANDVQLIAPTSVKKLITGSAKASKEEVAQSLSAYCQHPEFECDDESDAMAVAVAWLIKNNYLSQIPLDKYKECVNDD